ncbi:MAG: immunity 53 family protein [Propionibacteriaceae bacterium]|nr:immunity 53 family protein [Propionibacteriaceae bacterium]
MNETRGCALERLQQWYSAQCDGEWEHGYGVRIESLDNPGWSLAIDLTGTSVRLEVGRKVEVERDDDDWYQIWVSDDRGSLSLLAACGPLNLSEVVEIVLEWLEG